MSQALLHTLIDMAKTLSLSRSLGFLLIVFLNSDHLYGGHGCPVQPSPYFTFRIALVMHTFCKWWICDHLNRKRSQKISSNPVNLSLFIYKKRTHASHKMVVEGRKGGITETASENSSFLTVSPGWKTQTQQGTLCGAVSMSASMVE